jgi:precorrin-6B methylase 2
MDYDAELQLHNRPLLGACAIRDHEHLLDIGCGTGQTTREAARLAATGSALGVDITEPVIARARVLAATEGVRNVSVRAGQRAGSRVPAAALRRRDEPLRHDVLC